MAQVKEVKGPGPRRMGGPKPKVENPGKLLKRIMDEVFKHYLPHCILVLVCIIVSALANVQASLFLKTLIDDYIVPMTKQANTGLRPAGRRTGAHWLHLRHRRAGRMAQRPYHGQRDPGHPAQPARPAFHPHGEPAHPVF